MFGDEVDDVHSCCPQSSLCGVVQVFDWVLIGILVIWWCGVGCGVCVQVWGGVWGLWGCRVCVGFGLHVHVCGDVLGGVGIGCLVGIR